MADIDSTRSSFRESLIEHAFISAVLQEAWRRQMVIEVLRPEVDAGVDVVFECGTVVRHVQLKSTRAGAKVARYNVNTSLAAKPSGAVVLIEFQDEAGQLLLKYRFFGGAPGEPLSLNGFNAAKQSRGNAKGVKLEWPGHRVVPAGQFKRVSDITALVDLLFGRRNPSTDRETD
jgi:hypothetical protein